MDDYQAIPPHERPQPERRRQDAGLACLLFGGLMGLGVGFLLGLIF